MPLLPGKKNIGRNIATEEKAGKSRDQAIAIALNVARKHKADGGGILPNLESNPYGWGAGPALTPYEHPLAAPMWKNRALAAATDALAARDAIGTPDVAIPIGLAKGATNLGSMLSGFSGAQEGGEALAKGDYGTAALDIGSAAAPYLGPMGSALATAIKYAPKSTGAALALLGTTAMPSAAEEASADKILNGLYQQKSDLLRQQREAQNRQDANRPRNLGRSTPQTDPNYWAATHDLNGLTDQLSAIDAQINRRENDLSPEHQQDIAQRQKEIDDANAKTARATPIRDQYPWLPTALTAAGLTASAALPFLLRAKGNLGTFLPGSLAGRLGEATDAATTAIKSQNAPDALRSAKEIDDLIASRPTGMGEFGRAGAAALSGGALAGEASMLPDQYDAYNLPEGPLKEQARERALNPLNYVERGAMGALTGLSGYEFGNLIPSRTPNYARAKAASDMIKGQQTADELALVRRNLGIDGADGAATALPGGLPPGPGGPLLPTSGEMASTRPTGLLRGEATDIETVPTLPAGSANPAVEKALNVAKQQSQKGASSPAPVPAVPSSDDLSDQASKIVKEFKKQGIRQWQHGDRVVHRNAPGSPEGGQFTSAPKTSTKTASNKGKAGTPTTQPDVAVDPDSGVPIKPPKDFDPDDPINRGSAKGGVIRGALDIAKKYARGGVVVGPVIGNTGGRTDALPVDVPANSYVLPADFVSALGENNSLAGAKVLDKMFGGHRQSHAAGGSVPIKISDGEYVLSPEQVAKIGGGDLEQGNRILDHWVKQKRAEHIKTLQGLPGPSR